MASTTSPISPPIDDASPPRPPFSLPLPGLWVWLGCVVLALLANSPSLRGLDFLWLDKELVLHNSLLNQLAGVQTIWFGAADPSTYPLPHYSPLTQTTFFIDKMLYGEHAWGYHLTSLLIHGTAGAMLWQLLRKLAVPAPLVVALLFVVHPVNVESVTHLAERRNPLAALLGLASMFLILRAAGIIAAPTTSKPIFLPDDPKRLYAMGIALFIVGLFAHSAIATLPLVMLLIAWWTGRRVQPAFAATAIGLLIAGVAMLSLTSTIEKNRAGAPSLASWNRADSAAGELAVRTQIAGRAAAFYVGKLALPIGLAVDYPRWQTPHDVASFREFDPDPTHTGVRKPDIAPDNFVAYAWPAGVAAIVLSAWLLRSRVGRTPFVVIASFLLLLAPALGFVDLGWMRFTFVADRAAYLASIPFLIGLVALGAILLARAGDQIAAGLTAGIVLIIYVVLSTNLSRRASRNESWFWLTSWNAVLDSRAWHPRYELARSLLSANTTIDDAITAIDAVRHVRPDEPSALVLQGKVVVSRGDLTGGMSRFEESIHTFPSYAPAYFAAAEMFRVEADARPTDANRRALALQGYEAAAHYDPLDAKAFIRLGETCYEIARRLDPGDKQIPQLIEHATQSFDQAVQLQPYDVDVLVEVADTLVKMQQLHSAGKLLLTAQRIDPNRAEVYLVIADAALQAGDLNGAEGALHAALRHDPKAIRAYVNLGALRQSQERWDESKEMLGKALEIDPKQPEALRRLKEVEARAATQPSTLPTRLMP